MSTPDVIPVSPAPPVAPSRAAQLDDPADPAEAEVVARVAEFLQLSPAAAPGGGSSLEFLLDVTVPVRAELGHVTLPIAKVLDLGPGSVVELDREVSQPVDLTVCGELFARGEVVVVEDRFAVLIKEVLPSRGKRPR